MSTVVNLLKLKVLKFLGFSYKKSKSAFGVPYVIVLGDYFSENPYFEKTVNSKEIACCVSWCSNLDHPLIFDVGAHCGYMSTHFAQLLSDNNPLIYAFEPVYPTYQNLLKSIELLGLENYIIPLHLALSDKEEVVTLSYSKKNSMLAQIFTEKNNFRAGNQVYWAGAIKIDTIYEKLKRSPNLIKIDVEGYETFVFRGAKRILEKPTLPAICLEWNPLALKECRSNTKEFLAALEQYNFFYINDYERKSSKFLELIANPQDIDWVCNLFALPKSYQFVEEWKKNTDSILSKIY